MERPVHLFSMFVIYCFVRNHVVGSEVVSNKTLNTVFYKNTATVNLSVGMEYTNLVTKMYEESRFKVKYTILCLNPSAFYEIKMVTDNKLVAFIQGDSIKTLKCDEDGAPIPTTSNVSGEFEVSLGTDLLGRTWLDFILLGNSSDFIDNVDLNTTSRDDIGIVKGRVLRMLVTVIKTKRLIDDIFRICISVMLVTTTIGFGCKTDLDIVKESLKRPIAPGIGVMCQYLLMPLIAFGIAKSINFENPAVALGIFACGICPGGGISNIYCYVLNGDVSLSVTMTTISTIAALGMIPLWMFTLGQLFNDEKTAINIPYANIMSTLAMVIIPLFVGMIIKYKCLKVSKVILKIIKPLSLITIVILLTFGIYVNLYIFRLFKPLHILAGCLLPYFGYLVGGIVALIFRQPWARVKTIAIETGIQNVGVAFLMLLTSLPPPDGDLAAVGPAASAIMTPLPLFVIAIIYVTYNKIKAKYHLVPTETETVNDKMKPAIEVNGNSVKTAKEIIINQNVSTV